MNVKSVMTFTHVKNAKRVQSTQNVCIICKSSRSPSSTYIITKEVNVGEKETTELKPCQQEVSLNNLVDEHQWTIVERSLMLWEENCFLPQNLQRQCDTTQIPMRPSRTPCAQANEVIKRAIADNAPTLWRRDAQAADASKSLCARNKPVATHNERRSIDQWLPNTIRSEQLGLKPSRRLLPLGAKRASCHLSRRRSPG